MSLVPFNWSDHFTLRAPNVIHLFPFTNARTAHVSNTTTPTDSVLRSRLDHHCGPRVRNSVLAEDIYRELHSAAFFSLDVIEGYRRVFSLEDTSLRHPYAVHERIPNLALFLICFVAPLVLQPLINLATIRSWWDLHNSTLGLILGLALTGAFTQITKITVGRPRPDIVDRCQPPPGSVDPVFGLSNWTICTQTDNAILRDGFRSFPSGHSSLSFAGLGFLSFYLAGKLHLFDKRGHTGKAWLALLPFAGASLVAVSRSMDYRHHWHDILVGSILGTVMGYFAYRQYYPSLASELSHRPYSPRIKRDESQDLPLRASGQYLNSDTGDNDLDGTVRRGGPGSLEEVWREGRHESVGNQQSHV
ncbi:phosphatidic acid phosphatase type 2/haloperoxidase [Mucidula mucida]|nr:phosphatidic acid phosphatase type 2/haloperoxidase [Mucidula mucida]